MPDLPVGQRYFMLNRSQIARLYHSSASLTPYGTILVTGCGTCINNTFASDVPFSPNGSPDGGEYRMEIFYPPFWYDTANKPVIASSPLSVTHNQQFVITYTGVNVTSVVFVATPATTHGVNQNQRVVKLVCLPNTGTTIVCTVSLNLSKGAGPP